MAQQWDRESDGHIIGQSKEGSDKFGLFQKSMLNPLNNTTKYIHENPPKITKILPLPNHTFVINW